MADSLKKQLLYICFPTFFNFRNECHNICVAFLEDLFIEFTTYVVKRVIVTQCKGSVKMDEYYGMF